MPTLTLDGDQQQRMLDAFLKAFNQDSFQQMLKLKLNKRLYDLVAPTGLKTMIFHVIEISQEENDLPQ